MRLEDVAPTLVDVHFASAPAPYPPRPKTHPLPSCCDKVPSQIRCSNCIRRNDGDIVKYIWIAVLATGCAVVSVCAQAVAIRCDTCQVDSDFRAEAVSRGPGTHIVYNVKDNLVQQWYVGPDDTVPAAVKAPPTPIVRQQAPQAKATQ
ncbi:hypothetical protein XAP3CFBP6996_021895 [Xanthomonas citri pv. fuscans CFBP 6996]|nr:hypothetical protein XAP3CFBP6996_021895 [Xanthomonas citri pv. fuscans CFBP 6996]QWN18698.1 hypothetical protein DGN02_22860 [Xanthomonas citri]RTE57463.1 hypothetical protein EI541_13285 [Xanthomonas axonopodis pv. eucalyptorum]